MSGALCANRWPGEISLGNTYVNDGLFTVRYGGENAFTSNTRNPSFGKVRTLLYIGGAVAIV